ncbi:TldD/PmbA family protein [Paracoccus aerodenitrificans]|uniref:TldD/PmbA family protein n=1 Tax=Paracoccus aerodenitrificans TaxID=3017781 RepID=UPI0022F137CC|nr:metallopeptidase TldD-related protein [Paracoccus aerodenitrificans]WBU63866.1 metallopeptidase TldD-related protein [Paracoccus aerodenitrificans]
MLESLTHAMLKAARDAGADDAEALAIRASATGIDVRAGRLEHAERAEGVEIGLRVLVGGRQASVSGADHTEETIAVMARRAVAMAQAAPVDDSLGLADPDQLMRDLDASALELYDPGAEPDPAMLEERALRAEAAALDTDGVSTVESASASYTTRDTWLALSNGFEGGHVRNYRSVSCTAISGTGQQMERDHAGEGRIWDEDMPEPEEVGRLAAERAVARSGASKPVTGSFPILYDERVSSGLIGHLLAAVNGAAIVRGSSWLRDAMDMQVLPQGITIHEDPHLARMTSSRIFDAEGLPTAPRDIVSDGILRGWSLDLATARKLGLESTASAVRGLGGPPAPGVSNIVMTQSGQSRDDLISQMGRGLVVTSLLGSSINPTTGDYSRGAAGFWVENGRISHAVNECTIAGNLRDILLRLIPANDARMWRSVRVPSLLVEGMTVAGA